MISAMCAPASTNRSAGMDVGNDCTARLRHINRRFVNDIGAHRLSRDQTGTLTDKDACYFTPVTSEISSITPTRPYLTKNVHPVVNTIALQALLNRRQDVLDVRRDRRRAQAICDNNLNRWVHFAVCLDRLVAAAESFLPRSGRVMYSSLTYMGLNFHEVHL